MTSDETKLLVMCILEPREMPSPTGIHNPRVIHKSYAKLLLQLPGFHDFAHIESYLDEETNETLYRLWALSDWLAQKEQVEARRAELAANANAIWVARWRYARAVSRLYGMGTSRNNAKEMVDNFISTRTRVAASDQILRTLGWYDTPTEKQLDEFQLRWSWKVGHVYNVPEDLGKENDTLGDIDADKPGAKKDEDEDDGE